MAIALCIGTHAFTQIAIAHYHQETKAEIVQITNLVEQNPIAKIILNLGGIGFIISNLVLPAMVFAFYWYLRRQVIKGKSNIDSLIYFSHITCLLFMINIVNDIALVLGELI